MADVPWCRSCGSAATADGACAACGTPLDRPESTQDRSGRLGQLRRRLTVRLANAPLAVRRAVAIDLIAQGRPLPAEIDLSEHEIAWYRAHAALTAGDVPAAVEQLAKLPEIGYTARIDLLLSGFAYLLAAPDSWPTAVAVLQPFVEESADAAAMVAALDRTAKNVVDVARRYVGLSLGDGPRARALAAYLQAVTGEADAVPDDLLRHLPPALLDRLAVAGALAAVPAGMPEPAVTRLRCRLGLAGTDEMVRSGYTAEAARRAFVAGDKATLDGLGDGPDVRHYRALHDYVTDGKLREHDLRPEARAVVRLTDAATIGFAGRRSVPDEVAADPTTWPRLWRNAVLGKLYPADGVAGRHPRFALWLELCGAYPDLRAGRWPAAVATAERIAAEADPGLRAEARNVEAYARWRLGQVDEAVRALGSARPSAGLAVNATLVASPRGASALPHLAKIMQLAEDDGLRATAVDEAVAFGERTGQVPATLGAMIRAALELPLDDDLHHRLLALAIKHDRAWLAGARLRGRRLDNRYFQGRAAYEEGPSTATLTEVSAALAALWRSRDRPAWAAAARGWLLPVVVEPPDAVDTIAAVDELSEAEVLDAGDGIALRALAGVRQIRAVEWSPRMGRTFPGDVALTRAVEAYRQRAGELEAAEREAVAALLAVKVGEAAIAAVNTAIRFWNGLDGRLRALARTTATTWVENKPNGAARQRLITDMRAYAERSERILRLTNGLPVEPEVVRQVRAFHVQVEEQLPHFARRAV